MRRRPRTVRVPWQDEDGDEYVAIGEVSPGSPGRGADMHQPGEPPEGPEVEVISIETEDGTEWPGMVPMAQADGKLLDKMAEAAGEADESSYDRALDYDAELGRQARAEIWRVLGRFSGAES